MSPEGLKRVGPYGPLLVVLPKWQAAPDPRHRGWVRTIDDLPAGLSTTVLPEPMR